MTFEDYCVLRKRLKKGKEFLHREYFTALGGKGRRDPEIMRIVEIWFKMGDMILQYEKENEMLPGQKNWKGHEEYNKLAND